MGKLFMGPALAAGMRLRSAWARAPSMTSVMRWEVSTLPAETAIGGRAFTTLPSGRGKLTGRKQPSLAGASPARRPRPTGAPGEAVPRDELQEPPLAGALRRDLGIEVAAALLGGAHIAEDELENSLVAHAGVVQLHGWDDDALLKELAGDRHRPRRHAADVGVVGAVRDVR